jgi:hypothetical protein
VRLGYGQLEKLRCPEAPCPASLGELGEVLIADARAGLTPADMVERKLAHLLGGHSWQAVMRGGRRGVGGYTNARTSTPGDSANGQTSHPGGTCYASN